VRNKNREEVLLSINISEDTDLKNVQRV